MMAIALNIILAFFLILFILLLLYKEHLHREDKKKLQEAMVLIMIATSYIKDEEIKKELDNFTFN